MVVAPYRMLGREDAKQAGRSRQTSQSYVDATELGIGVLFDRLLDAVVIARLPAARIVLWNPAAERLFGYTAEQAIGKSIEMLMPEPITKVHRVGLERYLRTGHGLIIDAGGPVEMPARTHTGEEIRIELSLSELRNPKGERFAVAVIRDAMHRKQIELTNLELTQARVARSEAETALSERDDLLDAVTAALQTAPAQDELQRIAGILAEIKRVHAGGLRMRPMAAELVDMVHAACDSARRRAGGHRLLVDTPPSALANFDAARTREALDQVLDEALRRSSDGSRIKVRINVLSPQTVQLTVSAEGTAEGHSLGVGLHLSRTLLQRQGGTLTTALSSSGSLEVVMTLPGVPHPARRRPTRTRKAGRAVPVP